MDSMLVGEFKYDLKSFISSTIKLIYEIKNEDHFFGSSHNPIEFKQFVSDH